MYDIESESPNNLIVNNHTKEKLPSKLDIKHTNTQKLGDLEQDN